MAKSFAQFLRVWFLLTFSYVFLKLAFDIVVSGWIDLRRASLLQLIVLPLGQSIVYWVVAHGATRGSD